VTTYADVALIVRDVLGDTAPSEMDRRMPDAELRRYMGSAMQTLFRNRQDLWVGRYTQVPAISPALTDDFPLPDMFVQSVADLAIALASSKDDESVNEGRVTVFGEKFSQVSPL